MEAASNALAEIFAAAIIMRLVFKLLFGSGVWSPCLTAKKYETT